MDDRVASLEMLLYEAKTDPPLLCENLERCRETPIAPVIDLPCENG